ncbi:AGR280Cp [Eremothecium gossypii ATCC 10895]|uniref:AGR280Cp n=1 Tax=Eremothecium gossypii (strain ATCC 10895 / CBS 109.51 / FGSC 9923 / NRRL Y-1056) TaxID=284811 RepID=Q74ZB9_EREGS|nr:AGR280Cp [Eremothecium gossypii ATCC 10895]AAS54770.2 AGR280Cp [Eremothecium gossypii ATCC 10895]AEY99101.1 FAGR280Cp [Eremothecium gossypii FDAG1]
MGRPPKEVSQEKIQRFQLELELAGKDIDLLLKDKKGRSRSCLLCQRRKQRCDHKIPSCTACLKAGVRCIQPAKYGTSAVGSSAAVRGCEMGEGYPRGAGSVHGAKGGARAGSPGDGEGGKEISVAGQRPAGVGQGNLHKRANNGKDDYTLFLEKKIKCLEQMIDLPQESALYKNKFAKYKRIAHLMKTGSDDEDELLTIPGGEADAGSRRVSADGESALPMQTKGKLVPGEQPRATEIRKLLCGPYEKVDYSLCLFAKYRVPEFLLYDPVFGIDKKQSQVFLDTYFTRIQFKYPLLDEREVYAFHDAYVSDSVQAYGTDAFHFACGRMWMVFSIAACLHMTTGEYLGLPPNRYLSTAISHLTKCNSALTPVQEVELLTLLVFYTIRIDRDSAALYEIIEDVVAICKNKLNLHQHTPYGNSDRKFRLFWCVYLLERMICVAVGKPYVIKESEIGLPLFQEDEPSLVNHDISGSAVTGVHFINQAIKLRRIESRFVEVLGIIPQVEDQWQQCSQLPRSKLQEQLSLVKEFFRELEIWRSNCSVANIRSFENETLKLYYYRSVRLLIQPYLELLDPQDRLFRECQAAAGQICQLYKIFHQKTVFGHSTPAVHTVFVAGVTLIYCMWLARNLDDERRRKLGDDSKHTKPSISASLFSTMDDLRACSICLYVMAERSKFAILFRDTFDQLMNSTVGNLIERCGPDSSELICVSSFVKNAMNKHTSITNRNGDILSRPSTKYGMPPAVQRTFGSDLLNAHTGFIGAEDKPLTKQTTNEKQNGLLRLVQVPRSLANLLSPMNQHGENDGAASSPPLKDNIIAESDSSPVLKNSNTGEGSNLCGTDIQGQGRDSRYIVKKSSTKTDLDWKLLQQQAFLQQQYAQHGLQAYLSSVNNENSMVSQQGPEIISPQMPLHASSMPMNDIKSGPSSPRWHNDTLRPIVGDPRAGSGIADSHPGVKKATSLLNQPAEPSASQTRPSGNLAVSAGPRRMFNCGTHNMINNISAWTNDSVLELLSNREPLAAELLPRSRLHSQTMDEEISLQQKTCHSANHDPSQPGVSAHWRLPLPGPSSSLNNNLPSLSQPSQHQQASETLWCIPIEEFWAVNDDYGFLT